MDVQKGREPGTQVLENAVVLVDGYRLRGQLVMVEQVAELERVGIAREALATAWLPVFEWAFLTSVEVEALDSGERHVARLMAVQRTAIRAISTAWA